MNTLTARVIGTGVLFIFVFLSGVWLSNLGRPINVIVLTIHKLIGLGTAIFIGVTVYQINQSVGLGATGWIAAAITPVFFFATLITGGLVSLEQPAAVVVAMIHKVGPFLTVFAAVVTLILLTNAQS